jgi:hypothetical protein
MAPRGNGSLGATRPAYGAPAGRPGPWPGRTHAAVDWRRSLRRIPAGARAYARGAPAPLQPRRRRCREIGSSRRRERPVVYQQPPVVPSAPLGDRQRPLPRGRRDYRNRGVAAGCPPRMVGG